MSSMEDKLSQVVGVTGCDKDQAQFYLDSANGDVATAVATHFESAGSASAGEDAELPGGPASRSHLNPPTTTAAAAAAVAQPQQSGAYTLSGQPAEPLPAGWGNNSGSSSASSSRPASSNRNPLRSNQGPRVTGFRDLASASSGSGGGGEGFGGMGGFGGGDDSDDEGEGKDPSNFYTGGAKSGLSVENPDDKRKGGASGDMIRNILQQAREGAKNLAGSMGGGAAGGASGSGSSSAFTGNAHTLGSDETPSSFVPDPSRPQGGASTGDDEEEEEEEVATRTLTFWQDGFSVEDGDLLKYEEHQELLAAIQSGRAPLSLLKVRHDQPVELRIAKRMNEKYERQPPPPAGPFSGSGNRLGSVSPYPDSTASTGTTMPGSFGTSSTSTSTQQPSSSASQPPTPISTQVAFEVNREEPTTQLQIRLRQGERMVATFNHTHTVGDIRRYINASRPGEASQPYALQTTFPSKDLTDDSVSLKEAGLLGSVVVQRGL